ncbi:MAG: hypothetical protein MZV64_52830 [Ignavibacteriales bacterium]|nr:hypothetical protein [Ignavibacteriales bacterium]
MDRRAEEGRGQEGLIAAGEPDAAGAVEDLVAARLHGLVAGQMVIDGVLRAVALELGHELRADLVGDAAGHGEDDDLARAVGLGQLDVALHQRARRVRRRR